ncbi:hypothetical protein D9M73_199300 [compost metagenome]
MVVRCVGEVVGTALVQRQQLANQFAVGAAGLAVAEDLPAAVQPGQVAQAGQAFAQCLQQARHGRRRGSVDVRLEHIDGLLGLQRQVQAQVIGQLGGRHQALLAQVGLGMAELGEQLSQQQAQQDQDEQGQRTFDRAAQGSGGSHGHGTQRRRRSEIGQAMVLRLGWRWQGLILHGVPIPRRPDTGGAL